LIPRWPSPSSSFNTCAPESTPSADSIGDGTGESPCGCGGGGVSLGGILSESKAGRRASRIRKGGSVAVFRGFRTNSSAVFRARTAGIHNVAGIPGQGGGRGAWYEGVYLHNTRLSGITTGGYMQICPTSSPIHRMLIQRPKFEFL